MPSSTPHNRIAIGPTPLVMGILNVTPDSFSDGGCYLEAEAAAAQARTMVAEGAAIIDVGPESTRPGAQPVSESEQIDRALPIIEGIRKENDRVAVSIDTRSASVARAALEAGADIVNDVSALQDDPDLPNVVATFGAHVILMHMRGTPADMQRGGGPQYEDVCAEISAFLCERRDYAVAHGIDRARIVLDPGIGFGKRIEHNLAILRNIDQFVALGQPVLVGASRKSFVGHVLQIEDPRQREFGSLACAAVAVMGGASIIRAHDVRSTVQAVRMCTAIRDAPETTGATTAD